MFDFQKNLFSVSNFSGGLYSTEDGIYFNPTFSDTFYKMNGNTAKAVYKTNHGAKSIPPGMAESEIYKNLKKFSFQYTTFAAYKDCIAFNYFDGNRSAVFFNTHSGNIAISDIHADSLNILFSNSLFESDGKLMMILDLNSLAGFIQRNAKTIQHHFPDVYAHVNFPKTKQNPMLLTFSLKPI